MLKFTNTSGHTYTIPNNPMQAYLMGKRHGTQECMDMCAMALTDKCGFHTFEETADCHDQQSIEYWYHCVEDISEAINEGRVKRKAIKKTLADEAKIAFVDD